MSTNAHSNITEHVFLLLFTFVVLDVKKKTSFYQSQNVSSTNITKISPTKATHCF